MIRLDDVVLNQWLHGGLSSNLKEELLSARMSTCFVANDVDTTQRMTAVLNYFEKGSPITEEEAFILYAALVHRPSRLLTEVDNLANHDKSELEATKNNLLNIAKERTRELTSWQEDYKTQLENETTTKQLLLRQKEIRERIDECMNQIKHRIESIEKSVPILSWYVFVILKILGISIPTILLYIYWSWISHQIADNLGETLIGIGIPSIFGISYILICPGRLKQLWANLQIESLGTYKKRTIQDMLREDNSYQELNEQLTKLKESDKEIESQLQLRF